MEMRLLQQNMMEKIFTIGFNSKYLIDIASEIEDKNLTFSLKNSTSPVLVFDNSDKNSFYVIMPMKI